VNLARRASRIALGTFLLAVGPLSFVAAQSASASGPDIALEVQVKSADSQPAAGAEVNVYLADHLLAKGITGSNGTVTVHFPVADVQTGLSVHAYGSGHQVRWSEVDPSLLVEKTTASFEVTLPKNATYIDVTGSWRGVKDKNPADYWHLTVSDDTGLVHATWGSGAAGHTGLHGVGVAERDVTKGNREAFINGTMNITEGGARYFGDISFTVVDDNEILISYTELELNNQPFSGQVVTNSEFVRVP